MKKFREEFDRIRARPEIYVRPVSFSAVSALVTGYDLALDGGVLFGFREWLIPRVPHARNLGWHDMVLHLAFPEHEKSRRIVLGSPAEEEKAIVTLFSLIAEFDDLRSSDQGLRRIFARYEHWLRRQRWYDHTSPIWIGEED